MRAIPAAWQDQPAFIDNLKEIFNENPSLA